MSNPNFCERLPFYSYFSFINLDENWKFYAEFDNSQKKEAVEKKIHSHEYCVFYT